jgi:hypothetical protein
MTLTMLEMFRPSANRINNAFGRMEIAEEEILKAQARHPEQADTLWEQFAILCPSPVLQGKGDHVYRAHCQELLDRVAANGDTRTGTLAEAAAMICGASLVAPLMESASLAYSKVFVALDLPSGGVQEECKERLAHAERLSPYAMEEADAFITKARKEATDSGRIARKGGDR